MLPTCVGVAVAFDGYTIAHLFKVLRLALLCGLWALWIILGTLFITLKLKIEKSGIFIMVGWWWGFAKQGTRSAPPRIETLLVGK